MVHYKLIYFPVRGFAEAARLVLHYANVPFEDCRVSFEDWPPLKPDAPFHQLPILEVDGKRLTQSLIIARFLAEKYGLAGSSPMESAQIAAIAQQAKDFFYRIRPYYSACGVTLVVKTIGKETRSPDELFDLLYKRGIENYMPMFEKLIRESGSGFVVKSGVSWADFYLASLVESIEGFSPELVKNYTEVLNHKKRVYGLPQLQNYLKTRPKTDV